MRRLPFYCPRRADRFCPQKTFASKDEVVVVKHAQDDVIKEKEKKKNNPDETTTRYQPAPPNRMHQNCKISLYKRVSTNYQPSTYTDNNIQISHIDKKK